MNAEVTSHDALSVITAALSVYSRSESMYSYDLRVFPYAERIFTLAQQNLDGSEQVIIRAAEMYFYAEATNAFAWKSEHRANIPSHRAEGLPHFTFSLYEGHSTHSHSPRS